MIRFIIPALIALMLAAGGCGGRKTAPPVERTTTITQEEALKIAKDAVRQHDAALADKGTYEIEASGNGWQISFQDDTGNEGRLIVVDGDGKVSLYQEG